MIDLETLDTKPNCVILTIGAVRFSPTGMGIVEKLELKPTIEDQTEKYKRTIDDETIEWWGKQSPEAVAEAFNEEGRLSFAECLEVLYKFCWNRRAIWSNGAGFDIVALETGFRNVGMAIPWPYYNARDTRTLFDITGVSLRDKKYGTRTTHKAVEDAEHQAIVVQDAYRKLIKLGLQL